MNNHEGIKCPICGEVMEEYVYAYDNKQYGNKYYKCKICGHKTNIIVK
ncbi:hypothetical protein JCM1393_02430 [Clostridium carnis]